VKPPADLAHLPWRIAGLVLLGGLVVAYQPELGDTMNRLVIPIAMAFATWLLVQNLAAVALGGGLLAAIHGDLRSADWILSVAYPALATVSAAIVITVYAQRFRRRIAATHRERWSRRRADQPEDDHP
jgi:cell division protein FtsW (lipid II flippase)